MATLFNVPVKRILVIALIALSSCKDSDKNSSLIFEELNESLERSNKNLKISTLEVINDLELKRREPATAAKAIVWGNRAYSVTDSSKNIIDFIDSTEQAVLTMSKTGRDKYSEKLDSMLKKYQTSVLTSDLYERNEFENRINFRPVNLASTSESSRIKASLLRIKNDIRNLENMAVRFCESQVGCLDCHNYEMFQAIAASNSSVFRKGQEMIITAGVGVFNIKSKPSFEINGMDIQPNENGVGEHKMTIKNKPGNYKVHVKIKYIKADGKQDSLEKDIEYTVMEPLPNDKKHK